MQCGSVSPTLPNLAQLILGSGQRLKCDEVVTYSHAVGVHLQDTHRGSVKRRKSDEWRDGSIEIIYLVVYTSSNIHSTVL